jgi:hypothetical protein
MKSSTPSTLGRWITLALLVTTPWLGLAQTAAPAAAPPAATPAPPPAAPPKRTAAELEKLVAPIALYPDPLLATVLPASVYPLEIVQAARFVADTNNLTKLDAQPWDDNVKAVARVPEAIKKLNEDISWTIELGDAFLAQDKDVMDAVQSMRGKAQKAGTLQTSPQQVVTVTNMIVEKTVEEKVVVVTNTVVQIAPASSTVVYVPTYNPYTVYYPPPAYYANPYPLLTFGAGMAMGAIIANNCNWYHGGCYHGGDVNIDIDRNVNRESNRNVNRDGSRSSNANSARSSATGGQQKWQPDQSRLSKSGSPSATARSAEARGWSSGGAKTSTGSAGARPSTGTAGARPSTGTASARPSTGTPSASRPSASPSASRPSPSSSASRPQVSPSSSRSSSSGSAFGGASSGASARSSSSRGAASRSSGGFSGGGGGGGRGGGGGGGRR